jgi:hypothetical protein
MGMKRSIHEPYSGTGKVVIVKGAIPLNLSNARNLNRFCKPVEKIPARFYMKRLEMIFAALYFQLRRRFNTNIDVFGKSLNDPISL